MIVITIRWIEACIDHRRNFFIAGKGWYGYITYRDRVADATIRDALESGRDIPNVTGCKTLARNELRLEVPHLYDRTLMSRHQHFNLPPIVLQPVTLGISRPD